MKSITVAIRNGENRVIGLLCINVNLDAPFSQVLQSFMPTQEAKEAASSVNFASDVEELVDQTVERTIEEINADKSVSNNTKTVRSSWSCTTKVSSISKTLSTVSQIA